MPSFQDITGGRFSRLVVLRRAPNAGDRVCWAALCDCGTEIVVRGDHLKSGHTQSCGCAQSDWAASGHLGNITRKHGGTGTAEYKAFKGAKERCTNPRHANWHGRGIEFRFETFEAFLAEVGPRPSPRHSIDRIDNDGHYATGNVRWATAKEQSNNRRERRTS